MPRFSAALGRERVAVHRVARPHHRVAGVAYGGEEGRQLVGDRVASPVTSSDDDNDYYKSKRQLDHEWYGDHSELNWRDREQAQAWGMDADTYVSNWLEHDKD